MCLLCRALADETAYTAKDESNVWHCYRLPHRPHGLSFAIQPFFNLESQDYSIICICHVHDLVISVAES